MHQGVQVIICLYRTRRLSISNFTLSRRWKDYWLKITLIKEATKSTSV